MTWPEAFVVVGSFVAVFGTVGFIAWLVNRDD